MEKFSNLVSGYEAAWRFGDPGAVNYERQITEGSKEQ